LVGVSRLADIVDGEGRDLCDTTLSTTTGGAMSMLRFMILIVATAAMFHAAAARAQDLPFQPTPEQRAACGADYNKFCLGMIPGGGRIIACLGRQYDQLSESCRKLVDASRKPGE
jgi:hypothetical protein